MLTFGDFSYVLPGGSVLDATGVATPQVFNLPNNAAESTLVSSRDTDGYTEIPGSLRLKTNVPSLYLTSAGSVNEWRILANISDAVNDVLRFSNTGIADGHAFEVFSSAASHIARVGRVSTTQSCLLQLGNGRTGSGYAYIDLVGDTTYASYGLRIIRGNSGANTTTQLLHRGTGTFAITAQDAAAIQFATNGSGRLVIDSAGRLYGTALHNNPSGIAGANQYIGSGTWTPTITGVVNVSGSGANVGQYKRVGDVVTLSVYVSITATAAGVLTTARLSLPIGSNFSATTQCIGGGAAQRAGQIMPVQVTSDSASDELRIDFLSAAIGSHAVTIHATMLVQ